MTRLRITVRTTRPPVNQELPIPRLFTAITAAHPRVAGPRPFPVGFSLALHAAILSLVAFGPRPSIKSESMYQQLIAPQEKKLVWYKFQDKLPDVSPLGQLSKATPPRTEAKSEKQTIVSKPLNAPRGNQVVWQPAPQLKLQQEIPLPNLLAFKTPVIAPPPPKPGPKVFEPPPQVAKNVPAAPNIPEAPALKASDAKLNPVLDDRIAALMKPKPRSFTPPAEKKRLAPNIPPTPDAPALQASLNTTLPGVSAIQAVPVIKPRAFTPPVPKMARLTIPQPGLPAAPQIAGANTEHAPLRSLPQHELEAALANRPKFSPPSGSARRGGSGGVGGPAEPGIQEAPALPASLPSNLNAAVVGLNPSDKLNGPLPDASRAAQFSAGPDGTGRSEVGGAVDGARVYVPDLMIRSGKPAPSPAMIARVAPTSHENLMAAVRSAPARPAFETTPREHTGGLAAAQVSNAPDPQFTGREVYTLAIQMPNITSYTGSWIMWFAERDPRVGGRHDLKLPAPLRKVDPKYIPSAIDDRVEGTVQLSGVVGIDGRVDMLRLLKGLDERLDRSAAEALLKWEFEPAQLNGTPVAVDLVVEIPFRLAPRAAR